MFILYEQTYKATETVNCALKALFWPVVEFDKICMNSKNYSKAEDNL